jgi:hypothetical protein
MTVRTLAFVLTAALALPAAAAQAPARTRATGSAPGSRQAAAPVASSAAATGPMDLYLLAGGEWGGSGYGALRLRADLALDLKKPVAPQTRLTGVLSVGLSRFSDETTAGVPGVATVTARSSAFTFEVVPTLRAEHALQPRVTLYADAGLGLGYTSASAEIIQTGNTQLPPGVVVASGVGSGAFAVLKLGAGGWWRVDERFQLGAEVVGANLRFGSGAGATYALLVGGSYRL